MGAPLTAPTANTQGVSDVNQVVELIRKQFSAKKAQLDKIDALLLTATNKYQAAFDFLIGRMGQDTANNIIKQAVSNALVRSSGSQNDAGILNFDAEQLNSLDSDSDVWSLSPGAAALGGLIAKFPQRFGKLLITSNFDPLMEVSIRKAGYPAWRTSLSVDGSINNSFSDGCQVIHIHGYWHGKDTLHTSTQLVASRPTLKSDLLAHLKDKLVVVIAYGGWQDIFTGALGGIVSDDNLFPDILWACYEDEPVLTDYLLSSLDPGIKRNRVTFYKGVDCHKLLPELLKLWEEDIETPATISDSENSIVQPGPTKAKLFKLAPLDCDRPPSIDVWVGRDDEIRALETSLARVVIICGLGGEGKSVLAANYVNSIASENTKYSVWDWRDCKEQGDRIRTQLVQMAIRLSGGTITASNLSELEDEELVEVVVGICEDVNAVLVFDNVDSHIDLENGNFTGLLDKFVQKIAQSQSRSRVICTCRPEVIYSSSSIITLRLGGISQDEAIDLFRQRSGGLDVPEVDVREAHGITNGHAFWLDLIAVQATKVPGTTLRKFLNDLRRGREGGPDVLSSIWGTLAPGEHTLLRFMAETVRPETAEMIEKFVASQLNLHRFRRALRSLIKLNLVVVKPEANAPDLYDLHPLVRHFVRGKYVRDERSDYIRVVISHYERIIGVIESYLGINLPFSMLERWSQKVELEVSAGLFENAFETIRKVEHALFGGGHLQEYVRVARLLLESIEWETAATKYDSFDQVVAVTASAFELLDDSESAGQIMDRHEGTIPQKTVRYIKHCDMRAYAAWLRDDFQTSIEWARRGVSLKRETNVDTSFDCEHTLALAQRDSGNPEQAIEFFLNGSSVEELLDDGASTTRSGTVFGNVGRCLQFMGRQNEALKLYKFSLRALERDTSSLIRSNKAYGRTWVAEILSGMGDIDRAEAFYMDAIHLLGNWAPVRTRNAIKQLNNIHPDGSPFMSQSKAQRIVSSWIGSTS